MNDKVCMCFYMHGCVLGGSFLLPQNAPVLQSGGVPNKRYKKNTLEQQRKIR